MIYLKFTFLKQNRDCNKDLLKILNYHCFMASGFFDGWPRKMAFSCILSRQTQPCLHAFVLVPSYLHAVFELNSLECLDYFEFCNNNTRSNSSFKILMKSAKVNAFKYSSWESLRNGTTYPTTFLEMTLILTNLNTIWKSG